MRAPEFWSRPPGLWSTALAPIGAIWAAATARRVARPPDVRPGVPVICIGNLTAGGTGKTPIAQAVLERLIASGRAPHALSRGYGGALKGPVQVDLGRHGAADVGDEPLLLAGIAPTWIARDRAAGARAAEAAGAGALVLDDGFQNPSVAKDLSILVVDAEVGFGNRRVIPAGPLREPVVAGVKRADLLILLGPEAARATCRKTLPAGAPPVIEGAVHPLATGLDWTGLPVLAFAGIGRPKKFFDTLRAVGAEVKATRAFGDHEPYTPAILTRLEREAGSLGAMLATTEKDAARLPAEMRARVRVLPIRVAFDTAGEARLTDALAALR